MTDSPLELIHCDVWGPPPISFVSELRYYTVFIDEFSKYTWLFPMSHKSDVYDIFQCFKLKLNEAMLRIFHT